VRTPLRQAAGSLSASVGQRGTTKKRMKTIKSKTILISVLFTGMFFTACKQELSESKQIFIQNKTDDFIQVKVFPKAEYLSEGGWMYRVSDRGSGYRGFEFNLSPRDEWRYEWGEVLFSSGDLNIEPYALAVKVFDSIHISMADSIIIKFTPNTVIGYSENIFTENSTWDFRLNEWRKCGNGWCRPIKEHCYIFSIEKEKCKK
jgi:hypothetical protein